MSDKLRFGLVELKSSCQRCGSPLCINGPLTKMICGSCQGEINVPQDVYLDTLNDLFKEWVDNSWGELDGSGHTVMGNFNRETLIARQTPCCRGCKNDFTAEELADRPGQDAWELMCAKCSKVMPVSRPPAWMKSKFPTIDMLFNAETAQPTQEAEQPARAVAFSCPSCGGGLKVDGKDRMVPCGFCQTEVYLPDDLWLRLHPVKTVERWYIGFSAFPKKYDERRSKKKRKAKLRKALEPIEDQIEALRKEISKIEDDASLPRDAQKARIAEIEIKKSALSMQKKKIKAEMDG